VSHTDPGTTAVQVHPQQPLRVILRRSLACGFEMTPVVGCKWNTPRCPIDILG